MGSHPLSTPNRLLAILLLLLLTSGCSTTRSLSPVRTGDLNQALAQGTSLRIEESELGWLSAAPRLDGDTLIRAGERASLGMSSALQGAANNGTGASSVLAGAAIGSALAAGTGPTAAEQAALEEARRRVEPLRAALSAYDWQGFYRSRFESSLADAGFRLAPDGETTLWIKPWVRFSADLSSLRLVTEARLGRGSTLLYAGRIESFATPQICTECTQIWTQDNAAALRAAAQESVIDTATLLAKDWQTPSLTARAGAESTLRYPLGEYRHVERGRPVTVDTQRSVYLDLHGWIKSMPVGIAPLSGSGSNAAG